MLQTDSDAFAAGQAAFNQVIYSSKVHKFCQRHY